jgi:putative ABC transport system permease protein
VLLGGTGLFLQMLNAARAQRVGFAVDGVAMIETDARYAGYSTMQARNVAEEIRRRVASIPAVRSAALTRGLPMQVTGLRLVIANGDGPTIRAGAIWAGPGYFETLGIPILHGRAIDERDRRGTTRAAVVSEAMAREYFGTSNAVGRRFRLEQDVDDWFEIVGIARNSGTANLSSDLLDPTPHLFYRSFIQADVPADTVIGRTTLDALGLVADMQREIRATDSALPVISATTMAQYLEDSLLVPSAAVTVLGTLGALGLGLAAIGLYAIVAFRVSRRVREIGIRMALGARRAHVVRTVTTEIAVLLGFGTGSGLLLSLLAVGALRAVSSPAPGVTLYRPTTDPVMLMAIAAIMGGVGLAAASVPAWRAARMDPLTALRHD